MLAILLNRQLLNVKIHTASWWKRYIFCYSAWRHLLLLDLLRVFFRDVYDRKTVQKIRSWIECRNSIFSPRYSAQLRWSCSELSSSEIEEMFCELTKKITRKHLMVLLLTTKITVSHFISANFYCFVMKNSTSHCTSLSRARGCTLPSPTSKSIPDLDCTLE